MDSKLVEGQVTKIIQTKGPTLFEVNKTMIAGFESPGQRAFPDIKEGSFIRASITKEDKPKIISYEFYNPELILKKFSQETYEPLRESYNKFVQVINQSVKDNKTIILHHDNDCDGHTAAYQIELVLKKVFKGHTIQKRTSRNPYFSLEDANRDLQISEKSLVIIIDNGSTKENYEGIKRLKDFDQKVIIIDHHEIDERIPKLVDAHINPREQGLSYDLCTGMLAFEFAHATTNYKNYLVPAVASYKDLSKAKEANFYQEKAPAYKEVAEALDYEIRKARLENRAVLSAILNEDNKIHKELIKQDNEEINNYKKIFEKLCEEFVSREGELLLVNLQGMSNRTYPTSRVVMDWIKEKYDSKLILGILDYRISMRSKGIDLNDLMKKVMNEFPDVTGGGHKDRATISFLRNKEEIIKKIKLVVS